VGVTTVVGFDVFATTWEWRATGDLVRCVTRRATVVVVVDATVVVVIITDVVPDAMVADGLTMSAIAGSTVALSTKPATSEPIEPMRTERRGARRDAEDLTRGSPERFCPCVKLVMDQLSKISSKVLPTTCQHLLNSDAHWGTTAKLEAKGDRGPTSSNRRLKLASARMMQIRGSPTPTRFERRKLGNARDSDSGCKECRRSRHLASFTRFAREMLHHYKIRN
jgi:hypothetical protein